MNWTKALLTSALFWVLVFFEYAILSMGLNLEGAVFIVFFYIFLAIITMICAVVYFNQPKTITVIEWAEKIKKILPKKTIKIIIRLKGENKREIVIR